jgi:hypothetical protein
MRRSNRVDQMPLAEVLGGHGGDLKASGIMLGPRMRDLWGAHEM